MHGGVRGRGLITPSYSIVGLHTDPASLSAPVPDFYFSRFYYLFFAKSGNKTLYSEKVEQVYDKIKETGKNAERTTAPNQGIER